MKNWEWRHWVPIFALAAIAASVGFAIIRVEHYFTVDVVVFAEKGDLLLLGARTLEGLNLAVDARQKKLVAAGPVPAAALKNDLDFGLASNRIDPDLHPLQDL